MSIKGAKENKLPIFRERFSSLRGDMTQADFAKFIGISRPTVGFYENGDRLPDALALKKIAEKCDVSTDWLLGLSDVRSTEQDKKMICETIGLSEIAVDKLKTNQSYFKKKTLEYLIVNDFLLGRLTTYFIEFLYEEKKKTIFSIIRTPRLEYASQITFANIIEVLPKCKESFKTLVLDKPELLKEMLLELIDREVPYDMCRQMVENMPREREYEFDYSEPSEDELSRFAAIDRMAQMEPEPSVSEVEQNFYNEHFYEVYKELLEYKENKLKKRSEQNANNHTEERDV